MKKVGSLILALALMLTMLCCMTACGEDPVDADNGTTSSSESTTTTTADSPFPDVLTNVAAYPVPDVSNSGWEFAGGLMNGVDMTQDQANAALVEFGGVMQIVFVDETTVNLIDGTGTISGTYQTVADGYFLDIRFSDVAYYGVFTAVEEQTVLIVVNKNDDTVAMYMTQISEH